MLQILIDGQALDMPRDFSADITVTNPIFNDRGSQTLPITVPATNRNMRITGFLTRPDCRRDPAKPSVACRVVDGAMNLTGTVNFTSAGIKSGISFSIGFDAATVYERWNKLPLAQLTSLPVLTILDPDDSDYPGDQLMSYLYQVYASADPQTQPLAVFPVAVDNPYTETTTTVGDQERTVKNWCYEILNLPTDRGLTPPSRVWRIIDGVRTEVSVPAYYGVTAFVRVWRLLELICEDAGFTIDERYGNPFKTDLELSRLVVLNNSADACCTSSLNYAELMPDCTVAEFLNSLWVRFGLVYDVSLVTGKISFRLIKDVVDDAPAMSLDTMLAGMPDVKFNKPQCVKLTAQRSFDGAATASDRFEDFTAGIDLSHLHIGKDVANWTRNGDTNDWDYDIEPEQPEPPDPEPPDIDDDRDDDRDMAPARVRQANGNATEGVVAYEVRTGQWYLLDPTNGMVKQPSSGFFDWDPRPPECETVELSSADECVPVGRVKLQQPVQFNDLVPMYLAGARHRHTYVKSGDTTSDEASTTASHKSGAATPLALAFALTGCTECPAGTIGRITGEDATGKLVTFGTGANAQRHSLSLFFQFKNGLFDRFWRRYDEFLRHGNRSVEVDLQYPKNSLMSVDVLRPARFSNLPCLVDTLNYSWPASNSVAVKAKLRMLSMSGDYDLDAEQHVISPLDALK